MGYTHIAAPHAGRIQRFYQQHFNPYLNFHRPCGQPEIESNAKGKQKRVYRHLGNLSRSCPRPPAISLEALGHCPGGKDTAAARRRPRLFAKPRRQTRKRGGCPVENETWNRSAIPTFPQLRRRFSRYQNQKTRKEPQLRSPNPRLQAHPSMRKDLPARISALRALTSALSSAMSCDSRLGSSIAFSLCGGGFRRRGACRRNLRKSQKPTQGERPPITNAWIASPPVRNQRRPRPKPAPGKTATPTQENQERAQPRALRVADSVSVASEQQQRDGEPDSSQNFHRA